MFQRWRDILFLHFSLPPAEVQALLPSGLTVDTYPNKEGEERAWIGLVPFRMEGIRPRGLPAVPGLSAFPETNVRTYVHRGGKRPGVWFFSLDAARWLACRLARISFHLPYFHATMETSLEGRLVTYRSERKEGPLANLQIKAEKGLALPAPQPGSFEFFLVERYLLYSKRGDKLFSGMVNHVPYPLESAAVKSCNQNFMDAVGIRSGDWEHTCFSPGVDVEVFGLKPEPEYEQ